MQKVKCIFFTVFSLLLFYGRAHGSFASSLQYSILKKKTEVFGSTKKFSPDKKNKNNFFKRKLKSRHLEDLILRAGEFSFKQFYATRDILISKKDHHACSFERYLPCKRGPPLG